MIKIVKMYIINKKKQIQVQIAYFCTAVIAHDSVLSHH